MITLPELAAQDLGSFLASDTKDRFGSSHARLAELIPFAARLAIDCIGNSDGRRTILPAGAYGKRAFVLLASRANGLAFVRGLYSLSMVSYH